MNISARFSSVLIISAVFAVAVFAWANIAFAAATIAVPGDQPDLSSALAAAVDGDTIALSADVTVTAEFIVNKAVTIEGNGHTLYAAFDKTSNSNNSAIGIGHSDVTIHNLVIDGAAGGQVWNIQLHGINIYQSTGVNLDTVTISNFGGSGVVVNGSNVTATNLNTSGNVWNAVNVDPGSGVTDPSVFTLNSGTLAESTQIWSDGAHVTETATVAVNAPGYTMYAYPQEGAKAFVWTNRALIDVATITRDGLSSIYSTIQAAVNAASTTVAETINVTAGMYEEQVTIDKSLTLSGAGSSQTTIKAPGSLTDTGFGLNLVTVTGSGVSAELTGLKIAGPGPSGCGSIGAGIFVGGLANANIHDNAIADITDSSVSGCQNGQGIYVGRQSLSTTGTATITNNVITGYQKGGIVVSNSGSSATITGNTVTGIGATPLIAPNGVQISDGATGTITNNTISGNECDYSSCGSDWYTQTQSAGILLFNAVGPVTVSGNSVSGNDIGIYSQLTGGASTVSNNTLSANRYFGFLMESGDASVSGGSITGSGQGILNPSEHTSGTLSVNNVNLSGNTVAVQNDAAGYSFDATQNYWGNATGPVVGTDIAGAGDADVVFSPWYTDAEMTTLTTGTPTDNGDGTASSEPTDGDTTMTGESTENGSVTVTAEIPSGTVITGDDTWDGTITAPSATTTTVTASTGFSITVTSAVAIGSSDSDLTFSQGVRLTFVGQAGQHIGWYNHAGTFTEITAVCADDSQATGDALAEGGDCKIDSGSDLVVWTRHFSTFATYTQTAIAVGGGGGGISSAPPASTPGGSTPATPATPAVSPATPATPAPQGQVLGAATFNFAVNLKVGSRGADVTELQSVLIAGGFLNIAAPTGYFGGLTKAAVQKYQKAHGVSPQSGFVGPLTRAVLNQGTTVTATSTLQSLQQQLLTLQARLNVLLGR